MLPSSNGRKTQGYNYMSFFFSLPCLSLSKEDNPRWCEWKVLLSTNLPRSGTVRLRIRQSHTSIRNSPRKAPFYFSITFCNIRRLFS